MTATEQWMEAPDGSSTSSNRMCGKAVYGMPRERDTNVAYAKKRGGIAAVPGFDLLLIGNSDLTLEMGIHGQCRAP